MYKVTIYFNDGRVTEQVFEEYDKACLAVEKVRDFVGIYVREVKEIKR